MNLLLPHLRDGLWLVPLVALGFGLSSGGVAAAAVLLSAMFVWVNLAIGAWLMKGYSARIAVGAPGEWFALGLALKPVVVLGAFMALMLALGPLPVVAGLATVLLAVGLRPLVDTLRHPVVPELAPEFAPPVLRGPAQET